MLMGMAGLGMCLLAAVGGTDAAAPQELSRPAVTMRPEGVMGRYVKNIVAQWLLTAPEVNPGMVEMMRLRDRKPPYEDPVPWAGEFVGKYLTSAVMMRRLDDDPRLDAVIRATIKDLLSTQAEDGYLGPFKKEERLLGNWDLWGHYHAMLALYTWYKDTGDQEALNAATRAADLVCKTYLDTGKRIYDAGSAEMNMAVIHSLGLLYRETQKPEYLRMMREIEKDWEKPPAGDYLRLAKTGVEYYQTPKPRWESLHPMLGLAEFFRITGEGQYRDALAHWWSSIRRTDVHNTGSFSTNEQATGNPFMSGSIETCCTVAWIAYSIETLKLTGDPAVADALELATWNAVLGYEHPSGRWCTYDTPMSGKRLASAHSIVFQSRPGTPELNCCSVNGPRGLAMLSEWAVLANTKGIYLNFYAPGTTEAKLDDGAAWRFDQAGAFPKDGSLQITVHPGTTKTTSLFLRIPAWSKKTRVRVNGADRTAGVSPALPEAQSGTYLEISRGWKEGDVISIDFDMSWRALRGDGHVDWKTSLYRGPILLTYDQMYNDFDPAEIPELDLAALKLEPVTPGVGQWEPITALRATALDGKTITLVDFATAGAHGTRYESWLPVRNAPAAPFSLEIPELNARLSPEDLTFSWGALPEGTEYALAIARDKEMKDVVQHVAGLKEAQAEVGKLSANGNETYYWQVTAREDNQVVKATDGPRAFTIDPSQPSRTKGAVLRAPLHGTSAPEEGKVTEERDLTPAPGPDGKENGALAFNGSTSKLVYEAPGFPLRAYTLAAWFRAEGVDANDKHWHEIASAWYAGSNDALRVAITGDELIARIEQPGGCPQTPGVRVEEGKWTHVALVKDGNALRLYVNGKETGSVAVPELLASDPKKIGIGCNPVFGDIEGFQGAISGVVFLRQAADAEEIAKMAEAK
jgi:DUF1680 family protein